MRDRTVTVFTNCQNPELYLNRRNRGKGKSLKKKWPELPFAPVIWENIKYIPGCIPATVADKDGNRCYKSYLPLEIQVSGSAYLRGDKVQTRGGIVKFAIRSSGEKGPADISIGGEGLRISNAVIHCEYA